MHVCFFLFIVCLYTCVCDVYFKTTIIKQNIKIILMRECLRARRFLITATPSVLVPSVLGALAVWIQNQPKKMDPLCFKATIPCIRVGFCLFFASLLVFVLAATCIMRHQDCIPGLTHSQYPCMQPYFTPTSSPPTAPHLIAISILAIN